MARFQIKALVTVEVEMVVHADHASAAKKLFGDKIIMTAGLADADPDEFEVVEDSIYEVTVHSAKKE